jgi:outer membrane protein TolC
MPGFRALEEWTMDSCLCNLWERSAALLLAGSLLGAVAEADERLTLVEAMTRALSYYPSLQATAAQIEVAEEAVDEAEAARFPTVSVGASAFRYKEAMLVYPIHAFTPDLVPPFDPTLFQAVADVRYSLYDGGGRSARIEESRARRQNAEASLLEARQNLLSQLIQQYLSALAGARMLEAQDRSIQALEAELSRVKQLFDVGRAATVDVLRVEAAIAAARAERVRVASSLDLARRNLARLVGIEISATVSSNLVPVALADTSVPSREETLKSALESSPRVRLARDELAVAEAVYDGSRSRRLPSVNVDGRYINYAAASGDNSREWNVGVSLDYTVYNGGAVASGIARSQSAARSAAETLRWTELEVAGEVDRAFSAVEEAAARIESLRTAVARFEEVSRIEKLRLDTGVGTESDYVRAEADRLEAEAGLIEARYAEIAARAELARVAGSLSPEWVTENLRSEP